MRSYFIEICLGIGDVLRGYLLRLNTAANAVFVQEVLCLDRR